MFFAQKKLGEISIRRFDNKVYVYNNENSLINTHIFEKSEKFAISFLADKKEYMVRHGNDNNGYTFEFYNLDGKLTNKIVENVK